MSPDLVEQLANAASNAIRARRDTKRSGEVTESHIWIERRGVHRAPRADAP